MNRGEKDEIRPSPQLPEWLELLDHTADAGIVVHARALKELFARAAWGMFSVITEVNTIHPRERVGITLEADDAHALMVRWLSELNYRHVIEHRLFGRFDVTALTGRRLDAEVYGEKTDLNRHTIYTEIKAITFHALRIEELKTGWEATIVFDL